MVGLGTFLWLRFIDRGGGVWLSTLASIPAPPPSPTLLLGAFVICKGLFEDLSAFLVQPPAASFFCVPWAPHAVALPTARRGDSCLQPDGTSTLKRLFPAITEDTQFFTFHHEEGLLFATRLGLGVAGEGGRGVCCPAFGWAGLSARHPAPSGIHAACAHVDGVGGVPSAVGEGVLLRRWRVGGARGLLLRGSVQPAIQSGQAARLFFLKPWRVSFCVRPPKGG